MNPSLHKKLKITIVTLWFKGNFFPDDDIISRYLINLAQLFSTFYNENKIIDDDENTKQARVYLTYCTNIVLKEGASLLGIQMPERM